MVKVPESWKTAADEGLVTTHAESGRQAAVDFVNNIQAKVSAQEGNTLPVSAFKDYVDGTTPSGTSAYEKRGIAVNIPVWNPENCIQCNRCSYVCPHAAFRPVGLQSLYPHLTVPDAAPVQTYARARRVQKLSICRIWKQMQLARAHSITL